MFGCFIEWRCCVGDSVVDWLVNKWYMSVGFVLMFLLEFLRLFWARGGNRRIRFLMLHFEIYDAAEFMMFVVYVRYVSARLIKSTFWEV